MKSYDGDMESYRELLLSERSDGRSRSRADAKGGIATGPSRQDLRRLAAERRAELAPLKKRVQAAESLMEKLSASIAKLDAALADQTIYARDPAKAQKLAMERGQLAKELATAEENWLMATEQYETAQAEAAEASA